MGITSAKDLSDYHLQFIAITTWLISKGQLGNLEQQQAYIQAFQPSLLNAIMNRLQLKNPDYHPNVPHKVKEVYEAAQFILQGYTVKQKRWPDWGLNPGPSRHIPDALTTELSGLYQQIN